MNHINTTHGTFTRRTFGAFAMGAMATACGGGGSTPPLEILEHPGSVSVESGESAVFSVSVQGETGFIFQWKRNGIPIPGAQHKTFIWENSKFTDTGSAFSVTVTNEQGTIESHTAILTVDLAVGINAFDWSIIPGTIVGIGGTRNLYVHETINGKGYLSKYRMDGTKIALAPAMASFELNAPSGYSSKPTIFEDSHGSLLIAETFLQNFSLNAAYADGGSRITQISSAGEIATLCNPTDVSLISPVIDNSGNIYAIDFGRYDLYQIKPSGVTVKIANLGKLPYSQTRGDHVVWRKVWLTTDIDGALFAGISAPDVPVTLAKVLPFISVTQISMGWNESENGFSIKGLAVHANQLYALVFEHNYFNNVIRRLSSRGELVTVAGMGSGGEVGFLPGSIDREMEWVGQGTDGTIYLGKTRYAEGKMVRSSLAIKQPNG